MTEPDVEALKRYYRRRQARGVEDLPMSLYLRAGQLPLIIAALEDRERLRAEVAKLRTWILRVGHDFEANIELARQELRPPKGQTVEELKAALEGRDG